MNTGVTFSVRHWGRDCVQVVPGSDGITRVFSQTGLCLGRLVDEHEINETAETETITDGVRAYRGAMLACTISAVFLLVLYLAFHLGAWFARSHP